MAHCKNISVVLNPLCQKGVWISQGIFLKLIYFNVFPEFHLLIKQISGSNS